MLKLLIKFVAILLIPVVAALCIAFAILATIVLLIGRIFVKFELQEAMFMSAIVPIALAIFVYAEILDEHYFDEYENTLDDY